MSRWTGSSARGGADLSVTWRDDDRFHDECGLFGIWNHPEAANVAYLGLYAPQHRGQESAGIAATDGINFHTEKAMGWVADVFSPERLRRLPGHRAIGHVRYSTAGSSNLRNAQPITANTRSEEHTSELQSQSNLVCRLLLEKKKHKKKMRMECTEGWYVHEWSGEIH